MLASARAPANTPAPASNQDELIRNEAAVVRESSAQYWERAGRHTDGDGWNTVILSLGAVLFVAGFTARWWSMQPGDAVAGAQAPGKRLY